MFTEQIKEYGRWLGIASFRNVVVKNVEQLISMLSEAASPAEIQLFDADKVAGREHLFFAALNALKAFKEGIKISRSLSLEAILYASAQRQIKNAIEMLGVRNGTINLAVMVLAEDEASIIRFEEWLRIKLSWIPDSSAIESWTTEKVEGIKSLFKISDLEMEKMLGKDVAIEAVIKKLVVERVALLATMI